MTNGLVSAETERLLGQLDPSRSYGFAAGGRDLTYEEVVAGVRDGRLLILEGFHRPQIKDRETGWPLRGSGKALGDNQGPQQAAIAEFRRLAIDDVPEVYEGIMAGVREGRDWHWHDLFLKYVVGKVGEVRGGDEMARALQMLIARMDTPERRSVEVFDG